MFSSPSLLHQSHVRIIDIERLRGLMTQKGSPQYDPAHGSTRHARLWRGAGEPNKGVIQHATEIPMNNQHDKGAANQPARSV